MGVKLRTTTNAASQTRAATSKVSNTSFIAQGTRQELVGRTRGELEVQKKTILKVLLKKAQRSTDLCSALRPARCSRRQRSLIQRLRQHHQQRWRKPRTMVQMAAGHCPKTAA
eukprot:COSAG02_NODE_8707_length_2467_cov_1.525338_1_plen_113_part_00